jgi:single-stranded-DNA-specific exonuclease
MAGEGLDQLSPPLVIDAEVDCRLLDLEMMEHLRYLEPFGHSNPHPVLASRGIRLHAQPRVVGEKHLKLQFSQGGMVVEGIGFNMGHLACELNGSVGAELDVAFSPTLNRYWAEPRVEMEVKDLRRANL